MENIYKNIEEINPNNKRKILIVFYKIVNVLTNKKLNLVVTEFLIRGRNLNYVFISKSDFAFPQNIGLNSTHYIIMKIPMKRELQQSTFNHSSDTDFKTSRIFTKKYTAKQFSFLVIDFTLASYNPSRFRKNLLVIK